MPANAGSAPSYPFAYGYQDPAGQFRTVVGYGGATPPAGAWTTASGASCVTVGAGKSGSATVKVSVAANTGALRTGAATIAGKAVAITQAAPIGRGKSGK